MYYTGDMTKTQNTSQADTIRAFLAGQITWRGVARLTGLSRENVLNLAGLVQRREMGA